MKYICANEGKKRRSSRERRGTSASSDKVQHSTPHSIVAKHTLSSTESAIDSLDAGMSLAKLTFTMNTLPPHLITNCNMNLKRSTHKCWYLCKCLNWFHIPSNNIQLLWDTFSKGSKTSKYPLIPIKMPTTKFFFHFHC